MIDHRRTEVWFVDIVKEEVKGSKKIELDAPGNDGGSGDVSKITKELEFDLNKPLKLVLKEVFDKEGTVMLAFQGAPYNQVCVKYKGKISCHSTKQVLKYANSINYQLQSHMDTKAQALTRQITDITGEDTECTSVCLIVTQPFGQVCHMPTAA